MVNILFTGVGGPTPRSFAIALKKYSSYKNANLIGVDVNPLAIGLYQSELFSKTYVVPPANDPGYWKAIQKVVSENSIEYAVIQPEVEVLEWSKRFDTEQGLPCYAFLPPHEVVMLLVDKAKMSDVLVESGLVPPTVSFDRHSYDYSELKSKLGVPFWVRASSGTSGLGSLKIFAKEALENWIEINPSVEHFIASSYLPGRNLGCKLLFYEGQLLRAATAERVKYIMAKVSPSGITGNTSFGRFLNEEQIVRRSAEAVEQIFSKASAVPHGFFTVDLKECEKGAAYITEINVRHVAFTQCFAALGANLPSDILDLHFNKENFDLNYQMYQFDSEMVFLRDVDSLPILVKGTDLLR